MWLKMSKLHSRFGCFGALAAFPIQIAKVALSAVDHLPGHLRVIPALVGDLPVGILKVEVGWVSILVGVP